MAKKHGDQKIKLSMCKSAMSLWAEISHFFKKISSEVSHPEKSEYIYCTMACHPYIALLYSNKDYDGYVDYLVFIKLFTDHS